VERFNRTVKSKFRKIGFYANDRNETQWSRFRNQFARKYNYEWVHQGISDFLREEAKKDGNDELSEFVKGGISPADVDPTLEKYMMEKKDDETELIKEIFEEDKPIRVGMIVRYLVTDPWDEEKNFPDAFLKKSYGWSKNTFAVSRRFPKKRGSSVGGRTYLLRDDDGDELPRRFLPWELKIESDANVQEAESQTDDVRVGVTGDHLMDALEDL